MSGEFQFAVLVGFLAQLVDGTIGMAYGLTATTGLLALGISPLQASASVHFAEVITTGASGGFHARRGHVSWPLVRSLVVTGLAGALVGAVALVYTTPLNVDRARHAVSAYLLVMGLWLVWRARTQHARPRVALTRAPLVGFLGGMFDALGGGWGPIVTGNIMMSHVEPKIAVGSSIVAEFAVTMMHAAVFLTLGGLRPDRVMLGLMLGGLIAAPIGPRLAATLPRSAMIVAVGIALVISALWQLMR